MEMLLRAGLSNAVAATLMAVLVTALSRPLARRPAILHGLWLLVLIKLVTPPIYDMPIPWMAPSTAEAPGRFTVALVEVEAADVDSCDDPEASEAIELDIDAPSPEAPIRPLLARLGTDRGASFFGLDAGDAGRWIGLAWITGSAIVLLVSLRRIRRFRRLLDEARSGSWLEQEWVDDWAGRMGLRHGPDLWWFPGAVSPMIWFVGARPRLIVPQELWKRLDGRQRSTLIVHELAHLRRRDHLVRLLELAVTVLFWWHPLVWWLRGPLRDAEEQCCDAWVVWALPDAVRAYAETLLDTLDFLRPSGCPDPLLASGLGELPSLKRRLTMIMSGTSRRLPGLPGRLGLMLVAATVLPVGALRAQKANDAEEAQVVLKGDVHLVERPEPLEATELKLRLDPARGPDSGDHAVLVLRVDGDDESSIGVQVSGTVADVIKKLEKQLAELKQLREKTDATKEEIKALEKALEALKAHGGTAARTSKDASDSDGARKSSQARVVLRRVTKDREEQAAEVNRLRQEIHNHRATLEATLKKIREAQAKIRELGGEPGETPTLAWHPSRRGTSVERRIVVRTPDQALFRTNRPESPRTDQHRLELLEKRLQDIQQELQRMKKDSAEGSATPK